jgi:uncharacterized protein YqeY
VTLVERINQDLTAAMKARDAERLSALRMVKTSLKNREIEKMAALEDTEATKVLQSLVKQRRDSIEQYERAKRLDLAAKEAAEIKVIEAYLPATLDETAIAAIVDQTVVEIGADSPKDLGRAMKAVMARLAGQPVDGKIVNELVRKRLVGMPPA